MKKLFYHVSLAFLFIALITSCNPKKENITTLRIVKISTPDEALAFDSVKVSYVPIMDQEFILLSRLDSSGTAYDTLDIQEPVLATFWVGKNYSQLCIRPGDKLTVTIDAIDKKNVVYRYSSEDEKNNVAHINTYFDQTNRIVNTSSQSFLDMEADTFMLAFDSLTTSVNQNYKNFSDSVALNDEEKNLITTFNKLRFLHSKMDYLFTKHNNFLVDQIYAFRDGKEIQEYKIPDPLKNILNEIPMDTALLKSSMHGSSYRGLLFFYSREKYFNPYFNPQLWDKPSPLRPKADYDSVKNASFPISIKEYLLANNLRNDIAEKGVTEVIDSVYSAFAKDYPHSKYLPVIQKVYDQQVAILPGKYAPDFTGKKADGTIVNLSDFKGRVVYVDVWATWCGPCVEEIPDAIKLQEAFKGNDEIIFLNVSIDKDLEAWKNKIAKESDWKGVHINLTEEQKELLATNYRVTGWPRYFIIDKDGKIVTAKAPRPSSKEVIKNELSRLANSRRSM